MNAEERANLLREVEQSHNCSHPIRLRGEMVNLATGEVAESVLRVACKDRRRVVCPACSYLYKADAWILVSSGLVGGKGTPELVRAHPRLFVTLTAPSFGPVHTINARGGCVVLSQSDQGTTGCPHGRPRFCRLRHAVGDPALGRPLCDECFDVEGAVLWNAHAARLWNHTVQSLRRSLAHEGGIAQSRLATIVQVHYLKVAEVQRRGLVHFHAVLRVDGPETIEADPPEWLTSARLAQVVREAVSGARVFGFDGQVHRWGKVLDVRDLGVAEEDVTKVASYVAKYSTKTTDGSRELARRFRDRRQIEALVDDPHYRRLVLCAWDLAVRPDLEPLNLRLHANAFGYAGHLITKSRDYSTTFAALRSARAEFMAQRRAADPIEGSFHYDGRGYNDPRGTELAELFFTMERELREEALAARLGHKSAS